MNRVDGNGRGGVVGNRVRQRLAAADCHRSEVQAAAPEHDNAGTVRTSGEAIASGEQPQAARNHEGYGQPTMQPITVQSDLCVPSSQTTAGIWVRNSISGKDQCRSWWPRAIDCERAGWARHLANVRWPKSPFRDAPRCEGRKRRCSFQVIVNKWIKNRSCRDGSYRGHIRGGLIWRTLMSPTATCMMILHIAHMPSS